MVESIDKSKHLHTHVQFSKQSGIFRMQFQYVITCTFVQRTHSFKKTAYFQDLFDLF